MLRPGQIWPIWAVICLLAATLIKLFIGMGKMNGLYHIWCSWNHSLQYH